MSTRLSITVGDVMLRKSSFPVLPRHAILKEALDSMSKYSLGIACISDADNQQLLGILTDGDLRRRLLHVQKPFSAFLVDDALNHSIRDPITVQESSLLTEAVEIMDDKRIWDLPVLTNSGVLVGLLHLHPALHALLHYPSD